MITIIEKTYNLKLTENEFYVVLTALQAGNKSYFSTNEYEILVAMRDSMALEEDKQ